ncbi:hypothetical protein ABI59_19635 [Acidobacteria bacterium Mor1]|nr:hypothetical protein ABI59_19635 [Acidobacteria bacterium Mor1]
MPLASQVRFLLVEPQHPGNIGSAARALKNLGFRRLEVIRPKCDPRAEEARRRAVDAVELVDGITVHDDLDRGLGQARTVVGTSRRLGKHRKPHFRLDEVARELAAAARSGELALLFGREAHGLSDAELDRCTHLVYFDASEEYPSFNLAHAVLLTAHELRRAMREPLAEGALEPPAGHEAREAMLQHMEQTLLGIGFLHPHTREKMMRRIRRMYARAGLTESEVHILRGIARQTDWASGRKAGSPPSADDPSE